MVGRIWPPPRGIRPVLALHERCLVSEGPRLLQVLRLARGAVEREERADDLRRGPSIAAPRLPCARISGRV